MHNKKALIFIGVIIIVTGVVLVLYAAKKQDDAHVSQHAMQSGEDVQKNTVQKESEKQAQPKDTKNKDASMMTDEEKDTKKGEEEMKEKNEHKKTEQWYKPKPMTSWHWQLQGTINTAYDVEMYDIDLEETSPDVIDQLHAQGKKVICYFSAGTYEPFRSDAGLFVPKTRGKSVEGWEEEQWLDIAHFDGFASIMTDRLDTAVDKKCDGVEPDNVQAYLEDTGFALTYNDQLKYNKWLAREAHKRNLAIALKNDGEQVKDLINDFDFAIVEECFTYNECAPYTQFITKGKAVFGVEYEMSRKKFCPQARAQKFSWLKMDYDLDGGRKDCIGF